MDIIAPLDLLTALIRCPSVTPQEGGALALLESVLKPAGFSVQRPVFSEPGTADVENLYARYGTESPFLLFAGHTDVVPTGDVSLWRHDPFAAMVENGEIIGRGATDMKGGIACMVVAALRFIKNNPNFGGSIGFLITGDEEDVAINGTVKLLKWAHERGERFDYCILGEPTNPDQLGEMIKIGRRGSLTGTLTVQGKQGHAGYPHLAHNPIPDLLTLCKALLQPELDQGSSHFSRSNLEITSIDTGNPASNVIPAATSAVFNIRFNDLWTFESLEAELRSRLAKAANGKITYTLAFQPSNAPSFLTEPDAFVGELQQVVQAVTGLKPALSTTGGTSDARFIKDYCPVIEFGGVGKTMHQINESMALADIEPLTTIYEKMAAAFFAKTAS